MIRLDHLTLPVRDVPRSREWYTTLFGWRVEFEVPERRTVGLQDDADFTLILVESPDGRVVPSGTMAFQVDDVEEKCRDLEHRGIPIERSPQRLFWGYGAELRDPDGYLLYLWDERSMREKGSD